jgi:hypothetical protein
VLEDIIRPLGHQVVHVGGQKRNVHHLRVNMIRKHISAASISLLFSVTVQISDSYVFKLVPMAKWSETHTVFGSSNTGIMGSNPTQGTNVFPHFSALHCPV